MIIEVDDSIDLDPFIESANMIVTDVCSDSSYTDAKLELIERYLSAHFYTLRDPRAKIEQAGDVRVEYQSKVDLGFNTSHYGQMAMRLDTEGNLARLDQKALKGLSKASLKWLGTEEES